MVIGRKGISRKLVRSFSFSVSISDRDGAMSEI